MATTDGTGATLDMQGGGHGQDGHREISNIDRRDDLERGVIEDMDVKNLDEADAIPAEQEHEERGFDGAQNIFVIGPGVASDNSMSLMNFIDACSSMRLHEGRINADGGQWFMFLAQVLKASESLPSEGSSTVNMKWTLKTSVNKKIDLARTAEFKASQMPILGHFYYLATVALLVVYTATKFVALPFVGGVHILLMLCKKAGGTRERHDGFFIMCCKALIMYTTAKCYKLFQRCLRSMYGSAKPGAGFDPMEHAHENFLLRGRNLSAGVWGMSEVNERLRGSSIGVATLMLICVATLTVGPTSSLRSVSPSPQLCSHLCNRCANRRVSPRSPRAQCSGLASRDGDCGTF